MTRAASATHGTRAVVDISVCMLADAREEIRACFEPTKRPTPVLRFMMAGDTVTTAPMIAAFTLEGYRVEGLNVWARRKPKSRAPWFDRK